MNIFMRLYFKSIGKDFVETDDKLKDVKVLDWYRHIDKHGGRWTMLANYAYDDHKNMKKGDIYYVQRGDTFNSEFYYVKIISDLNTINFLYDIQILTKV